jgi:hypothetical protein
VKSINGSKGKRLTAKRDWDSVAYAGARELRSAIESLMFTIKEGVGFGVVARRGLGDVQRELLEKAFAYNLCHRMRIGDKRSNAPAHPASEPSPSWPSSCKYPRLQKR